MEPTEPWTAPEVPAPAGRFTADERTALEAALDEQRQIFLRKCGGLTGEQLARRSTEPSTMSLLGIARHLADVERWWFRRHFAGQSGLPFLFFDESDMDGDFNGASAADAAGDFAVYAAEVEQARAATAGSSPDDTFRRPSGEVTDLRWLFLHLIQEYARHNGHADLLREHLDGRTGE